MKRKTINAVIARRMKAWWESIDDDDLRALVERDTVVTGGCIASMLLREKVNDFDVYLRTRETALRLARYYVEVFRKGRCGDGMRDIYVDDTKDDRVRIVVKSAGVAAEGDDALDYQYFERATPEEAQGYVAEVYDDPGEIEELYEGTQEAALDVEGTPFRPVFLSTNAITLSGRVQIIVRFFGAPDEIHENYDFVHCTNYWTKETGCVLRPDALESLLSRELRYMGSRYPVCSLMRVRKFVARGWTINAGQILKMCMQVSALDLTKIEVLEDQLTGVDVAYFIEVIEMLRARGDGQVNAAYLLEILDRMF